MHPPALRHARMLRVHCVYSLKVAILDGATSAIYEQALGHTRTIGLGRCSTGAAASWSLFLVYLYLLLQNCDEMLL